MEKYDFDRIIDRKNTSCLKYDFGMKRKGRTDLLPMWVADMDFACRRRSWKISTNGSTMGSSGIRIRMQNTLLPWTGGSPSITGTTSSRNG